MSWTQTVITTTSAGVEHIEAKLIKCGISGWQVIDLEEMRSFLYDNPMHWDYIDERLFENMPEYVTIKLYTAADEAGRASLEAVKAELSGLANSNPHIDFGPLALSSNLVDDEDWHDAWKEFFVPLDIGERIVVRPAWEEHSSEGKLVVGIDPGYVFGTGQHETTRMCIEALERHVKPGDAMLDLGCGSGILSVVGLMLGADKCVAVDINPDAAGIVFHNAQINSISTDRISVHIGDIVNDPHIQELTGAGKYDCITANIVTDVIVPLMPIVAKRELLKPCGVLIVSGIIKDRLDESLIAAKSAGFTALETKESGEWASLVLGR